MVILSRYIDLSAVAPYPPCTVSGILLECLAIVQDDIEQQALADIGLAPDVLKSNKTDIREQPQFEYVDETKQG